MKVIETKLPGVLIIEPKVYGDDRGFFKEIFQENRYREAGVDMPFVQDNSSRSQKGVLRGIHFQRKRPQGKLVSCNRGTVYDVVVDVSPESKTFGQYVGIEISEDNHRQVWVPPGYGHGFCVMSNMADFQYKCTDFYCPEDEGGVLWSDPDLEINWPVTDPIVSEKDRQLPLLEDMVL